MSRICPTCRKPQTDTRLLACETCRQPFIEATEAHLTLSSDDLQALVARILRNPRFWLPVGLGILGLAYAVFSFIDWTTGKNAKEIVAQIATEASNRVSRAYAEVTNNLAGELRSPRIQQIMDQVVKEQAETRIDATADKIIAERIRTEIAPRLTTVDKKIAAIDATTERANAALLDLNKQTEFISTLVAAENDDRHALDRLKSWADDPTHPLSQLARQAWIKVRIYYAGVDRKPTATLSLPAGMDISTMTPDQFKRFYASLPPHLHAACLLQFWNRTNLPERVRMAFLVEVMKSDASINAVDYARKFFWKAAHLNESELSDQPLILDAALDWWKTNKAGIGVNPEIGK